MQQALDEIWREDKLGRRSEADSVQQFLIQESAFYRQLKRRSAVVLGIDAPYGRGKSWFLERLSKQVGLSHPVAFIDAWADDVGNEPLPAFMAAIDEALKPFLSKSAHLRDLMAITKAAALPVAAKLASGMALRFASKIAGEGIEQKLGEAIEGAAQQARNSADSSETDGKIASSVERAFDKLDEQIDSVLDRYGASLLASYRQRKRSREFFIERIGSLIDAIDHQTGSLRTPLFIFIDELDRCRPSYAISILEEIKHFFQIPGIVFVLGLHGEQLSKSINAVYGAEFKSDNYLRRFFTRRYSLREPGISELVEDLMHTWGINDDIFYPFQLNVEHQNITFAQKFGIVCSEFNVTPREVFQIMDGIRLFVSGWEHSEKIDIISLLCLIINMIRGSPIEFRCDEFRGSALFVGTSWNRERGGSPQNYSVRDYIDEVRRCHNRPLHELVNEGYVVTPAKNKLVEEWRAEFAGRRSDSKANAIKPRLFEYPTIIETLSHFSEDAG